MRNKIAEIIRKHGIVINCVSGRWLAEEVSTLGGEIVSEWVDVTDWTIEQVRDWLGY